MPPTQVNNMQGSNSIRDEVAYLKHRIQVLELNLGSSTTITAAAATVLDDTTVAAMTDTLGGASTTGTGGLVRSISPTFTGVPILPTPFTLGAVSVTPTGTELNFVDGVTSNIQTQLDTKAPIASPTFTTTATTPLLTLGTSSATNGVITIKNSAGAATVTLGATGAKSVLLDNTGHDVILGINGAPESGYALKVTGDAKVTGRLRAVDLNADTIDGQTLLGALTVGSNGASIQLDGANAVVNIGAGTGVSLDGPIRTAAGVFYDFGAVSAGLLIPTHSARINIGGTDYDMLLRSV